MRQKRLLTTVIALLLTVAMLPLQTFAAAPRSKKTVTVTLQSADVRNQADGCREYDDGQIFRYRKNRDRYGL